MILFLLHPSIETKQSQGAWIKKLDQETWLCRTHLDDFVGNILTILYHDRSYYTKLDSLGPFWSLLTM